MYNIPKVWLLSLEYEHKMNTNFIFIVHYSIVLKIGLLPLEYERNFIIFNCCLNRIYVTYTINFTNMFSLVIDNNSEKPLNTNF